MPIPRSIGIRAVEYRTADGRVVRRQARRGRSGQLLSLYRRPRLAHSAVNQAYYKGLIHSFSRWTNTLNEVTQSNWNVTPTADSTDGSSMRFTTPASAGVSYAGIGFRLDDLQNNSEFDNLFDFFKINAVKLTFNFLFDTNTLTSGSLSPQMYIVKDYDDSSLPASVGELIQYANCKEIQLYNKGRGRVTVYIRPRVMNTTTYEQSRDRKWIDMAGKSSVKYNGVKFAVVNRNSSFVNIFVKAKYYIQCKGQR